ncbi:hypothetical protein DFH09DRAFT_1325047 [Mycena vulgaris]|nr:hypothetical protein DFH09DRAFT_1325047 [Mycena vulgaris]
MTSDQTRIDGADDVLLILPLLGTYIVDTYWDRYNTICVAVVICLVRESLWIVAARDSTDETPPRVIVRSGVVGAFMVALRVMRFAPPLVAEQYRRTKLFVRTTSSGEKVTVDPVLNISRVYSQIEMTCSERYVGFWLDYTLPMVVFLLFSIMLFFGRNYYVRSPLTGSVPAMALRLSRNPIYRALSFLNNNLTSQAATMFTGNVPNDVLSNLDPFAFIIFIPICDLVICPALRRSGIRFTQLKKITAGFITGCAAMIWAAVVRQYIYKVTEATGQNRELVNEHVDVQADRYKLIHEMCAASTILLKNIKGAPPLKANDLKCTFIFLTCHRHAASTTPIQVTVCLIVLRIKNLSSTLTAPQLGLSALAGFALFVFVIRLQQRITTQQFTGTLRRGSMNWNKPPRDLREVQVRDQMGALQRS